MHYRKQKGFMSFSSEELKELAKAWIMVSLAFAILFGEQNLFSSLAISSVTVGTAFLLHELAHKMVAQNYGLFAEFRADNRMLAFAVISAFFGFVFAAPGAVVIRGRFSPEEYGKIALAGPAMNVLLAVLFLFSGPALPAGIAYYGFRINAWLALFNLIPVGNLDGAKVLKWNRSCYIIALAVSVVITFL